MFFRRPAKGGHRTQVVKSLHLLNKRFVDQIASHQWIVGQQTLLIVCVKGDLCGTMEYFINAPKKSLCAGRIGQIGFHPLNAGEELFGRGAVDREDLKHMRLSIVASVARANRFTHFRQAEQKMGSDKTGSTSDQDHGLKIAGTAFVPL